MGNKAVTLVPVGPVQINPPSSVHDRHRYPPALGGHPAPPPGARSWYPENSLVLDFTPDTIEQLRKTFHVEGGTWGMAFGSQGDYTPTDSTDELFAWTTTGSSVHLTFFADGTYKYEFTTMNIEETGTWTWSGWNLTVITAGGNSFTGSINK